MSVEIFGHLVLRCLAQSALADDLLGRFFEHLLSLLGRQLVGRRLLQSLVLSPGLVQLQHLLGRRSHVLVTLPVWVPHLVLAGIFVHKSFTLAGRHSRVLTANPLFEPVPDLDVLLVELDLATEVNVAVFCKLAHLTLAEGLRYHRCKLFARFLL